MRRGYGNDKIYRIIGGVRCERIGDGNFVCRQGLVAPQPQEEKSNGQR